MLRNIFWSMIFIPLVGYSQSVTIETENVPIEILRTPDLPLPSRIVTYTSAVSIPDADRSNLGLNEKSLAEQFVVLEGYKRVAVQGDIQILVSAGNFIVSGEKMDSRKTRTVDREGNPVTKQEFFMPLTYVLPVSYKIMDKSGNTLSDISVLGLNDKKSYKTDVFATELDLDSYWRINRPIKLASLQKEMLMEALAKVKEELNKNSGFPVTKMDARFKTLGKKKHPDYEKFNNAFNSVKSAITQMKVGAEIKGCIDNMQAAISFYEDAAQKYSASDKEEVKLKHMALYNLASLYYWTDNFDKADEYTRLLLEINPADKEALILSNDIQVTRKSLEFSGKITRH